MFLFAIVSLFAQTAVIPDVDQNPLAFVNLVFTAVNGKNWALLAALGVIGGTWAVRTFLGGRLPWVKTDRGGAVMSLAVSMALTVGSALITGGAAALSPGLLVTALIGSIMGSGGYSVGKKLITPPEPVPAPPLTKTQAMGSIDAMLDGKKKEG